MYAIIEKNPGFMHNNYNLRPSAATIGSINYSLENYKSIELKQKSKFKKFTDHLNIYNLTYDYIPWFDTFYSLDTMSIYNTIYVKNPQKFIKFFNKKYIPVIDNPTYKLFNFDYNGKKRYYI